MADRRAPTEAVTIRTCTYGLKAVSSAWGETEVATTTILDLVSHSWHIHIGPLVMTFLMIDLHPAFLVPS